MGHSENCDEQRHAQRPSVHEVRVFCVFGETQKQSPHGGSVLSENGTKDGCLHAGGLYLAVRGWTADSDRTGHLPDDPPCSLPELQGPRGQCGPHHVRGAHPFHHEVSFFYSTCDFIFFNTKLQNKVFT